MRKIPTPLTRINRDFNHEPIRARDPNLVPKDKGSAEQVRIPRYPILVVIALFLISTGQGKSPGRPTSKANLKILFIGNSLTYFNNMPQIFANLAIAAGEEVDVDQATVGGMPLRQLVDDPSVIQKINQQPWDIVVLQSDDISAFPDMYQIEIDTLNTFKSMIFQNNPATQIIYTMIWGLRDGVTVRELNGEIVFYSYEVYMNKIYDGTLEIANAAQFVISPVGWAWYSTILENAENKSLLFSFDGAHPSLHGSYLMACVMNAVVFQNRNSTSGFYAGIPEEKARYYQQIAASTVFDNLMRWNITPGIGDLDRNGTVDPADANLLRGHLAGNISLSSSALAAADLNGDGAVSAQDVVTLLRRIGARK